MLSGLWLPRNARKLLVLPLVMLLTVWIGSPSGPAALWRLQHAPEQVELHSTASGAAPEQTVRLQPQAQRRHSVSDAGPELSTSQQPAVAAARVSQVIISSQQPAVAATRVSQVITSTSQQPAVAAARASQVIQLPPGRQPATPPPHNGTRTILFWNKFYNNADFYVGYGRKPFLGCAQDNCVTTSNRSHLAEADAVLFHILNPVLPLPPRRPHQRFVFFLKEPPTLSAIREPRYRGVFNLTMTYRLDSDVVADYFSVERDAEPTPLPAVERRSKTVAWIVSHCETASGRELYVDELQRFIDVDVYGQCGPLRCPTPAHGADRHVCYQMVAEHYHFYLAFENSQCHDYVTEKLSLPLRYGLVPVVLGDSRAVYERLAPPGSFIHIADFAGPQQLADHLRYLMANRTAYLQYFDWRQQYRVGGQTTWCNLCRYLHESHAPQYYDDISSWWVDEGACSLETVVPEPDTAEGESAGLPERAT